MATPSGALEEGVFRKWYSKQAKKSKLHPNPDDSRHHYNWRGAFRAGAKPDESGHWPSKFKKKGHPRLIIDGKDTRK